MSFIDNQDVRYSFTADWSGLAEATSAILKRLDSINNSIDRVNSKSSFKKVSVTFRTFKNSINDTSKAFKGINQNLRALSINMRNLSYIGNAVGKVFSSITGIKLGDWLAEGTKESIAYIENLNLFKVAMGDSVDVGMKFVDTMSELYGMDPSNLYRYAGYFYQLTDAIGMTDEASAVLSLSLTKASNDIASLFNVDVETVVNNLASGLQGMSRAVRKYGMDIRAVTLQQTALNYGITTQVENMSEADRQALRYLTMMEQVKNATSQVVDETVQASGVIGDFARNIETPANQLRIFKEQITQLGRAIGNFLIPMLSKLLPILNGVVMALRTVLTFLSALTGFKLDFGGTSKGAADAAQAIAGIGDAAGGASKAAKELKKTLAPFDEINLLQAPTQDTGSGGGGGGASSEILDPRLLEAVKSMSLNLDEVSMKAHKVRDALLKFFGFDYVEVFNPDTGEFEKKLQWFSESFKQNLIDKFPQWTQTIEALFNNWSSIIESIKGLFSSLGEVVDTVKLKVKEFIDSLHLDEKFSKGIENLSGHLNSLSSWISEHKDQIADFILTVVGVVGAFKAFQTINKYIKPLITLGTKLAPLITTLVKFAAPILAVAASIALLYSNSEEFATSFKNLFSTIGDSFGPVLETIKTVALNFWASLQSLWEDHLQPMIQSIGDALAPILDTLSVAWESFSAIFQSIIETLGVLWETVVAPILAAVFDAVSSLMEIIDKLWEEILGPVLENILQTLPDLFDNVIKPVIEKVGQILGGLIELILALWNNILAPLIIWLLDILGPTIRNMMNTIWNVVAPIIQSISDIIDGVLLALKGVIDFLVGVFTGDWERAWRGIKEFFAGVWNTMVKVVETVLNIIIGAINTAIGFLWSALQSFVNSILSVVNRVAGLLGFNVSLSWGSPPPAIGYVTIPTVAMAAGGVVTGPTNALIGEGHYDEAVIPLGNSPQMDDFANTIAGKINNTEQVSLLREQNQLLRQLLERSGDSVGIRDLTKTITRIQRQEVRAGGV